MYRLLSHGHPLINGYSGYSPLHYEVKAALQAGDRGVIGELARDQEILVALDHQTEFQRWFEVVGLRLVIADAGGYRIYRVPKGPGPPPPLGPALRVQSITRICAATSSHGCRTAICARHGAPGGRRRAVKRS